MFLVSITICVYTCSQTQPTQPFYKLLVFFLPELKWIQSVREKKKQPTKPFFFFDFCMLWYDEAGYTVVGFFSTRNTFNLLNPAKWMCKYQIQLWAAYVPFLRNLVRWIIQR